jgi:hypothetical protein
MANNKNKAERMYIAPTRKIDISKFSKYDALTVKELKKLVIDKDISNDEREYIKRLIK